MTEPTASTPTVQTRQARGTFEVALPSLAPFHDAPDARLGRRGIDKRFAGDLAGVSRGEMISAGTAVQGSAAYSALEHVEGTLAGQRGAFTLQHTGVMARGTPSLAVTVVPDSGTGELEGLTGTMTIEVTGGQHHYVFDYALPAAAPPAAGPLPGAMPVAGPTAA